MKATGQILTSIVTAFLALLPANAGNVINILDLGARNDGSEDISAIVNANTGKGAIYLPAGVYRVDSPLKLVNSLRGDGYDRSSRPGPDDTWLISGIECSDGSAGVVEYTRSSGINVEYLNIKCHSCEDGIRIKPCEQMTSALISHVGIYDIRACGIRIDGTGSRPVYVEDVTLFGSGELPEGSTGIFIRAYDCRLTNIEAMGIQIGLDIRGGYTYGSNLHLWTGYIGKRDEGEWWRGTRGIVLSKSGIFCGSQVYPDTSYYLFEQKDGNKGGFDIHGLIYYDDGCESRSRYLDGALFHAGDGATPNLNILGGMMAVCGTDEHPLGMTKMYTPGQNIRGVTIRNNRSICGRNIDVLCLSDELPDYTVRSDVEGWRRFADIFDVAPSGTVTAKVSTDDGAVWDAVITKSAKGISTRFKALTPVCRDYRLKSGSGDGLLSLLIMKRSGTGFSLRFTTVSMTEYFRPVDYGHLRGLNYEPLL